MQESGLRAGRSAIISIKGISIEVWRQHYNTVRRHSPLAYKPLHQKQSCGRLHNPDSFAGHAGRSARTKHALACNLDHPMGAG